MEYHCGICVTVNVWESGMIKSIVVLAADCHDNKLSFFLKYFEKEEGINDNVKKLKYGTPVFFTSEREKIIELFDIDCLFDVSALELEALRLHALSNFGQFNQPYKPLKLGEFRVFYDKDHGLLDARKDYKSITISEVENKLMNSLYSGKVYQIFLNLIPNFTAEYLQDVINEEEKEIAKFDIDDLVKELKISYYADNFFIQTDKPEKYDLNEIYTFKSTKYENYKFDTYLLKVLNLGHRLVARYDGWFYAEDEATKDVEKYTRNIPSVKNTILSKYSKTEHFNYRVRSRVARFIFPLIYMNGISNKPLDLKINNLLPGYIFINYTDYKVLMGDIQMKNEELRYDNHQKLTSLIYRKSDFSNILKDWCMPIPILFNSK